ncbi:MAG: nucleotidyltransferase domain-containing protein [Myxococcota bacterium]|nr:nucleotidyltransferase domain-containing protein [Myxococcota bacterium]
MPEPARLLVERALAVAREAFGSELRSLALFGSHARGEATGASDIDLAVVVGELADDPYARVAGAKLALRVEEPPFLSFVIWRSAELAGHPWLLLDVATDGIVLLDDGGLERELQDVRARLRAYGSRRVRLPDGTWYWDLKPDWKPGDVVQV